MNMIRIKITKVLEGLIRRVAATGRPGESFAGRELLSNYGFTSTPLPGAEGIALMEGNKVFVIATDDRRYRLELEDDGEVAMYSDEGDKIHFKRGKEIEINSGNKVVINSASEVEITTPNVNITAAAINLTATAAVNVVAPVVSLGAASGGKSIATEDLLTLYNSHTHGAGVNPPNQQAGAAHKTSKVVAQ